MRYVARLLKVDDSDSTTLSCMILVEDPALKGSQKSQNLHENEMVGGLKFCWSILHETRDAATVATDSEMRGM